VGVLEAVDRQAGEVPLHAVGFYQYQGSFDSHRPSVKYPLVLFYIFEAAAERKPGRGACKAAFILVKYFVFKPA